MVGVVADGVVPPEAHESAEAVGPEVVVAVLALAGNQSVGLGELLALEVEDCLPSGVIILVDQGVVLGLVGVEL